MAIDDPQTFGVLGAALAVHHELGPGFREAIYVRAMHVELTSRHIPHEVEPRLDVVYRGHLLGSYHPDLLCFGEVIVEVKAGASIDRLACAQTLHYLAAASVTRGLLMNFGAPRLEWKRFLRAKPRTV